MPISSELLSYISSLYLNPFGSDIILYALEDDSLNDSIYLNAEIEYEGKNSLIMNLFDDSKINDENQINFEIKPELNTLLKNKTPFHAHKIILAQSPVLKAMFYTTQMKDSKLNQILIPNISEEGLKEFLKYLYTDKIDLNCDIAIEILNASTRYQLAQLENICSRFISSKIDFTNVLFLHQKAITSPNNSLANRCMNFIIRNGKEVLMHDTFSELNREDAFYYLNNDEIEVSELERFQAACKWAINKCKLKKFLMNNKNILQKENSNFHQEENDSNNLFQKQTTENFSFSYNIDPSIYSNSNYVPTPEEIREELGDIIYSIRFVKMEPNDFALHVLPLTILSNAESLSIFSFISTKGVTPIDKFIVSPRKKKGYKLLILAGDQDFHIEDVAKSIKDAWTSLGELVVHSSSIRDSIPTLKELMNYNSILLFSNFVISSPSVLGDIMAEYVENGGGCVIAAFSCVKKYNIDGRFLIENFMGVSLGDNDTTARSHSFNIIDQHHPIVQGLNNFDPGRYRGDISLLPGSYCIAKYSDGVPLIVEANMIRNGQVLNGRVITLNFFPVSSRINEKYWKGDGKHILLNALIYTSK